MTKKTSTDKRVTTPAGPAKRAERAVLRALHTKTDNRQFIAMLMAGGAAYSGIYTISSLPSGIQTAQGQVDAAALRTAASALASDSKKYSISSAEIEQRGRALSTGIVTNTGISEQDAQTIAREFLSAAEQPRFSASLRHEFKIIADKATHLHKSQQSFDAVPASDAAAVYILRDMQTSGPSIFGHLTGWIMYSGLLRGAMALALARVNRRHDRVEQEERSEIFDATVRDIRDIMTPKSTPPAPKGPA